MTVWRIAPILVVGVLAGCGTPEYREQRSLCASEWFEKIPPYYDQELILVTHSRQVPTGRTICTKTGNTVICDQVTTTEYYTVPSVRTIDRNKPRRDSKIKQCTQTACVKKYGNTACEV